MKFVKELNNWEIFERHGKFFAKDFSSDKPVISATSLKKIEKKIKEK